MIDNISEAVQHLLEQNAALVSAVGTYTSTAGEVNKIFVNTVPAKVVEDDTQHFIRIEEVDGIDDASKDGRGITTAIVSVDIYSDRNKVVHDLYKLTDVVLHDYSGTLEDIIIQESWYERKGMDYDENIERNMLRCEYRFRIWNE